MTAALVSAGAHVAWRSHIGVDWENEATSIGWNFLRPYLVPAQAFVFSRPQYVPSWIPDDSVSIIPPSIDPFAPKNQYLTDSSVRARLARIGVLNGVAAGGDLSFPPTDATAGGG